MNQSTINFCTDGTGPGCADPDTCYGPDGSVIPCSSIPANNQGSIPLECYNGTQPPGTPVANCGTGPS
jgi:hypothetical protein